MFDRVIGFGSKAGIWLSSRANRLRIRGARIEVMAFIVCGREKLRVLLGKSRYGTWGAPQEGVKLGESYEEALYRCLAVECKLDLPADGKSLARALHVRSIRPVGVLDLPPERHGERLVARDALGTPLESVVMKRKAYWMATILVGLEDDIAPVADGKELTELRWFTFEEAREVVEETNRGAKAKLLVACLNACEEDISG